MTRTKETQINPRAIQAQRNAVEAEYRLRAPKDFLLFAQGLVIASATGPQLLWNCLASFQKECFEALAPSLHAVRDGTHPKLQRFWIERTKGASKDADIAICLLWLLAFPARPLYIEAGAADQEQAGIIHQRMKSLLYHNPWLNEYVRLRTYSAINTQSQIAELRILAADTAGSHGQIPDVLVVNELSHIKKWEFVENLLDNADKMTRGLVIIATNAGIKGTPAHKLKQTVEGNKRRWSSYKWTRPAPWISKENIADAKARNTLSRYNRLWWGKWSSGKGDALSEEDIDCCLKRCEGPLPGPVVGWDYIMGLDLGISHDHAGLAVLGVHREQRSMRLARLVSWAPGDNGQVDLINVEQTVYDISRKFGVRWVGYDPYEARLMAQQLKRRGVNMQEMTFSSPKNLTVMACGLIECVPILEAFDDERLRRDFGKINIVEKPGRGYKLESVSDEFGHADVGTALIICLPKAMSLLDITARLLDGDSLICGGGVEEEQPWTDQDMDSLPDALKEICQSAAAYNRGEEEDNDDDWWKKGL